MKRSRFSEEQIIGILKEHQAGMSAADLCRKHGISDAPADWRGSIRVCTATSRAVPMTRICAGGYVNWHPNDGGSGIGACTPC